MVAMIIPRSSAVIDDLYRYELTRAWAPVPRADDPHVLYIMLNPSKADADQTDNTLTRCINYAKEWGYSRLTITNLFAYKATLPSDLVKASHNGVNVIGRDTDKYIISALKDADLVICGWGANVKRVKGGLARAQTVLDMVRTHSHHGPFALHTTEEGFPGHPLFLSGRLLPQEYTGPKT